MTETNRRGSVLISTLWILAILSVLALGVGFRISVELKLNRYAMDRLKARYIAMGAVVKVEDALSRAVNTCDSIFACGLTFADEPSMAAFFADALGDGSFSVGYKDGVIRRPGLRDEERCININTADPAKLARLPGMTSEMAACIVDWRDVDNVPLETGAEQGYYDLLERPYRCKNGPFTVPEELMLVKGMSAASFAGIKDYVTVYGEGKVNVNTAPYEVLIALGMTDLLAKRIIEYRNGPDAKPATPDDGVFPDVNIEVVLIDLPARESAIVVSLKNSFTTKSWYFKIESQGVVRSNVMKTLSCIVKKGEGKCQLVSYREY